MWRKLCIAVIVVAVAGFAFAGKFEKTATMDVNARRLGSAGGIAPTRAVLASENFDAGIPASWTIVDGNSDGLTWAGVASYGGSTLDGTPFAFVDSDAAGSGVTMDEELISPTYNTAGYTTLGLHFDHYFNTYTGADYADVDVSTDDGATWTNVYTTSADVGYWSAPDHQVIDISAYASSTMKVRFHYWNANWEWYWAVDNFEITDTLPQPPPECAYLRSCGPYYTTAAWIGDMAYNPNTGSMYQIEVGGGNGIFEWDVTTCTELSYCTGVFPISQRGIAYDPVENVCYVGSWNNEPYWGFNYEIYVVTPPPACSLVRIIYTQPDLYAISGLAWDADCEILWCITNDTPNDQLYALDGQTGTLLAGPYNVGWMSAADPYSAAGLAWVPEGPLDLDSYGGLLAVNQSGNAFEILDRSNGQSVAYCVLTAPTTGGWGAGHEWYSGNGWAGDNPTWTDNEHELPAFDLLTFSCPTIPPSDLTCDLVGNCIELAWTNNGAYTEIVVYRNDAPIATLGGTETSYTDCDFGAGFTFTYYVEADGNASATCDVFLVGNELYCFDFNIETCGWTLATVCPDTSCPNGVNDWEWGAPTWGPTLGELTCEDHILTHCYATQIDTEYAYSNSCSRLLSPVLYLAGGGLMELCHWYDIETNYDGANVKVSTDFGTTWTLVYPLSPYDGIINSSTTFYACLVDSQEGFTGNSGGWVTDYFDLSAFSGNIVIAFDFGSDASVDYPGWYLKYVHIYAPPVDVAENITPIRGSFALENAVPNPFTGMTEISFALPSKINADLKIYDASGRLVRTLASGTLNAGAHTMVWDGRDETGHTVNAGIYFYKLNAGANQAVKKVVLMR
jgi:hypothetical protein